MACASFLSSATGRVLRMLVGLGLIGWGVFLAVAASTITIGMILVVVGLLPLAAGLVDVCVFAPFFGVPFSGAKVRAHARERVQMMTPAHVSTPGNEPGFTQGRRS